MLDEGQIRTFFLVVVAYHNQLLHHFIQPDALCFAFWFGHVSDPLSTSIHSRCHDFVC